MVTDLAAGASGALADDTRALSAALAGLRERISTATDLAACLREAENLRGRALELRARERKPADRADRWTVLADLRERLATAGADAAKLEPVRYARCVELLGQLDAAAAEESVRFEALHGTVEHEVASYLARGTEGARVTRAKLNEATDRLAAIRAAAESVAADARALRDDDLAETLRTALAAAVAGLAAARPTQPRRVPRWACVVRLAQLLPDAEARLDDLAAAHERRAAFAETLKDVLAGHGMSFLGTDETKDRFILQFQRPDGAVYTAAVDGGEDDDLTLSYAIDGEADILVQPEPGQAVCDQTEAFLEAIHADLAPSGYHAGELRWDGKPARPRGPRSRAVQAGPGRQQRTTEGAVVTDPPGTGRAASSMYPLWVLSLDWELRRGRQVVLHGEVNDRFWLDGIPVSFRELLTDYLLTAGAEVIGWWDPVDGLTFPVDGHRELFRQGDGRARAGVPGERTTPARRMTPREDPGLDDPSPAPDARTRPGARLRRGQDQRPAGAQRGEQAAGGGRARPAADDASMTCSARCAGSRRCPSSRRRSYCRTRTRCCGRTTGRRQPSTCGCAPR